MPAIRRVSLLALVLAGLVVAPAASAKDTFVFFTTPSRGIGCVYDRPSSGAAFLRCDVAHVRKPPPRPASCKLDYGNAFGLYARGKPKRLCVGDTVFNSRALVLGYGRTRRFGPFSCTSRRSGLRCLNHSRHGFDLSRQKQLLF